MNEQSPARCTCPTGDGSLEHPCPAHLTECAPGAINLIDALLENPAIPMAAKARLRNIRGTVVALHERAPKDHGFDFVAHMERQKRFSAHTFGPGTRARGIVDHIRKELLEVEADPGDLCEWVDVAILALDGAWRSGATPQEIAAAIVTKQTKNESRVWPHWSTMPADKAIEHDRSGEKPRSTPAAPGIDLDSMVAVAVRAWGEHQASCRFTTLKGSLRKVCEAVIDASPKGGSTMVTDAYATALVQAMRDARAGVFDQERHVIATLNWLENRASKIISEQTTSAEVGS